MTTRSSRPRSLHYLTVIGRAAPDVDLTRIRAEMQLVSERWTAEYEHAHPLDAEPLMQDIVGDAGTPLIILFAAVGSVLIIGCANVTGLMMARAMERQREVAIRTAVGATRGQVVRQLLIEGVCARYPWPRAPLWSSF